MSTPMALDTWAEDVDRAISTYAMSGLEFSADDIRGVVKTPAPHPNAWGGRFSAAANNGVIRLTGYGKSKTRSRHGGVVSKWVGTAEHRLRAVAA